MSSEVIGGVWKMLNNKSWTTLQKCEDDSCGTCNARYNFAHNKSSTFMFAISFTLACFKSKH